jgi:Flp pilus assembly protein TadG
VRRFLTEDSGSALLEFAIVLPLLVVFVVGIYDFSGAFNQKQKIEQAAQEGAIIAGAQPTSDLTSTTAPASMLPVVTAIFNSLAGSGVLPNANSGACVAPGTATGSGMGPTYTIPGCSGGFPGDNLLITIDRGWVSGTGSPRSFGSRVTIVYPYHWQFNSVIQLMIPGANYAAITQLTESATVQNQM